MSILDNFRFTAYSYLKKKFCGWENDDPKVFCDVENPKLERMQLRLKCGTNGKPAPNYDMKKNYLKTYVGK